MDEAGHKEIHIVQFHWYEVLEQAKSVSRDGAQKVVASGVGVTGKGHNGTFWADGSVLNLVYQGGYMVYTVVKTHQTRQF